MPGKHEKRVLISETGRGRWSIALVLLLFTAMIISPLNAGENVSLPLLDMKLFEASDDVGEVRLAGSSEYDPDSQVFTLSGSGANMWADHDEFHFTWRRMSGDFILSANTEFIGEGVDPHLSLIHI